MNFSSSKMRAEFGSWQIDSEDSGKMWERWNQLSQKIKSTNRDILETKQQIETV